MRVSSEPEQVLAITFTKKATAEIRDRVVVQLEFAARNVPLKRDDEFERETRRLAEGVLQRDARMGWGLLENPRRLRGGDDRRSVRGDCAVDAGIVGWRRGADGRRKMLRRCITRRRGGR